MSTIDTSIAYALTNGYSGSSRFLGVVGTGTPSLQMTTTSDHTTEWTLADTGLAPFYRLHSVSTGTDQSLDVLNDAGTASINLIMSPTGSYSGQYWRFDPWPSEDVGGGYRLTNNFTGLSMHLDVYSDTMVLHLAEGDTTGQHWSLKPVANHDTTANTTPTPSSSSPASAATSATAGGAAASTSSSVSPQVTSGAQSSSPALSAGAIAGIAVSGLAAVALIICVIAFLVFGLGRKKRQQQGANQSGAQGYGAVSPDAKELVGNWNHQGMASPPLYDARGYGQHGGYATSQGVGQAQPVELPVDYRVELAGRPQQS